ncbi:acyl-CoA dehydrogenase family protein [Krasilnikovia sp. MM14-A1259]|uniref:acyl-CoA dehydrogenase family protein n=1 Tax=Krasilnikovia sp. MM14-A1259 TaxID=3373539 RepID=UPI003809B91E
MDPGALDAVRSAMDDGGALAAYRVFERLAWADDAAQVSAAGPDDWLVTGACALGTGWAALDRALAYSRSRVRRGAVPADHREYGLIVPHVVRLEAARAVLEETASRADAATTRDAGTEGAIARYLAVAACATALADGSVYGGPDPAAGTDRPGPGEPSTLDIARDRVRAHARTGGRFHRDLAAALGALPAGCGAPTAALALECLGAVLDAGDRPGAAVGELIAYAEGAAALARRAAAAAAGTLPADADRRFVPAVCAALSRIHARQVALTVAEVGLDPIAVTGGRRVSAARAVRLVRDPAGRAGLRDRVRAAQAGLFADLDAVAAALRAREAEMASPAR